jgi:hypothetical protein
MTRIDPMKTEPDSAPLHMIDLIRTKRDGGALTAREIGFVAAGAASGSIPWPRGCAASRSKKPRL